MGREVRQQHQGVPPLSISPSATSKDFENLIRIYALVAHRTRRLAILHRHQDSKALVTSYQELVIDCHSLLAIIEEQYLAADPSTFPTAKRLQHHQQGYATWSGGSSAARGGQVYGVKSAPASTQDGPGAKQLALLHAFGSLKESLNALSRTVRKISTPAFTNNTSPTTHTPTDGLLPPTLSTSARAPSRESTSSTSSSLTSTSSSSPIEYAAPAAEQPSPSSSKTAKDGNPQEPSARELPDTLERDLAAVLNSARAVVTVARKFEPRYGDTHKSQTDIRSETVQKNPSSQRMMTTTPTVASRVVNKRASLGSLFSRFTGGASAGGGQTLLKGSATVGRKSKSKRSLTQSGPSFDDSNYEGASRSQHILHHYPSAPQLNVQYEKQEHQTYHQPPDVPPKSPPHSDKTQALSKNFRRVVDVLTQLSTVVGSNLQEFRLLHKSLMANPKLDNKLLLDMEILGRCYEESLDQLVPLGDSLAVQWDEVVGGNLEEIQQLRHALDSQERRAQHMTRQCGELQMLNTTLLEENTMLRKEVEIMRKFGAEPCATPMSEDVRSVASIPLALPSPAAMDFDLTDQDLLAMPSALVSAPASPPDLDYGEIIDEQAEDTAGLNRLYSDVHKTEALLVDVEKRRRPSVRLSTLDRVPPPTSANRHSPRMGQHEPNSSRAPPSLHIDTNKSYGGGGGNRSPNVKSRKSMSSFHHHRHSRDLSDNRKSYASSSGSTSSSDLTRHLHVANTNYTSSPTSKSPLLLPFILPSSGSLWKELLPKNPKTDAAIVIQTHFRGYRARKMFKNVKLRLMIVNEMLDTEASYVKGLLTIHKEFMIPLKEEMYHSSSVISRRDYDTIFRYIDEIMAFNQLLLDDLVERIAFWHFEQVLGDIFVRAADSMKIYAHFVNNYDEAVETLSRVSDNPQFDKKLAEIAKVMGHRAPALTDLLITPVQRPPRYLLMLKELLKRTDARHPDFECLALAVGRMERTNQIINDRKKRFEMMKQMQASFVGSPIDFVASGRYLTHSGTLVELSDSASSTAADPRSIRAVFLFTDVVLCAEQIGSASSSPTRQHFTDPTTTNPKFAFRWALPIGDIVAIHHPPDDPLSIRLSWKSASASHLGVKTLYALTKDEHKKWSGMFGYALKSWPKVVRQSAMSGTGLIVAPGDGLHHSTSSPQSQIRTLTQSLQTIEDEIQHETQINTGYKLLEGLHSRTSTLLPTNPSDHVSHSFSVNPSSTHHPHPSKSSGKRWSANMLYQPSGFNTSPIQSHATHSPLLNSSQQPSHHHHQESNRRLGVLRSQALKQQVLRRELESVVS